MKILNLILSAFVCGCSPFYEKMDGMHLLEPLSFETRDEIWLRLRFLEESIWRADDFCTDKAKISVLHRYMILESTDKRLAPGDILYSLLPMEGGAFIQNTHWSVAERKQEIQARLLSETTVKWCSTEYLNSLVPNSVEDTDGFKRNTWFIFWGVYPEISKDTEKFLKEIYNNVHR